jgi:tetratricopeptide (TPR) repeat protein
MKANVEPARSAVVNGGVLSRQVRLSGVLLVGTLSLLLGCQAEVDPTTGSDADAPRPDGTPAKRAPALAPRLIELPAGWPTSSRAVTAATDLSGIAADAAALRALLVAEQFAELDAGLAAAERRATEQGSDRYLHALLEQLSGGDVLLEPLLDSWVERSTQSALAMTARGMHHLQRANSARGGRFSARTSDERLTTMRALLSKASSDFDAALALSPRLGPAHAGGISVRRHSSSHTSAKRLGLLRRALLALADAEFRSQRIEGLMQIAADQQHSYVVQQAVLFSLQPRWNGNLQSMFFAAGAVDATGRHDDFALLSSYAACLAADGWRVGEDELTAIGLHWAIDKRFGESLHPACVLHRARAERDEGRLVPATRLLKRYHALVPHNSFGTESLARVLLRQGHAEQASAILDAALQMRGADVALTCLRADLHRRAGEAAAALAAVERALQQNPLDDGCWMEKSNALADLDRLEEAEVASARARELSSDSSQARAHSALLALRQMKPDEAAAHADAMLADTPEDLAALFLKASAAGRKQQGAEAEALLDQILETDPNFMPAYYERGIVRVHLTRNIAGAAADLQRASEFSPHEPQVWFELAGARYKLRDCGFVDAFRRYRKLCEEADCPDDRVAWANRWLDDPGLPKLCPNR